MTANRFDMSDDTTLRVEYSRLQDRTRQYIGRIESAREALARAGWRWANDKATAPHREDVIRGLQYLATLVEPSELNPTAPTGGDHAQLARWLRDLGNYYKNTRHFGTEPLPLPDDQVPWFFAAAELLEESHTADHAT